MHNPWIRPGKVNADSTPLDSLRSGLEGDGRSDIAAIGIQARRMTGFIVYYNAHEP